MEAALPPTLQEHDFCLITEGVIGRTMQKKPYTTAYVQVLFTAWSLRELFQFHPGVSVRRSHHCDVNTTYVAGYKKKLARIHCHHNKMKVPDCFTQLWAQRVV